MAYALHDVIGGQPISETSTVLKHALGTRVRAVDPVYGQSEFIYLKGVASTVVGSLVAYNQKAGTTTLTVAATKGPVAIAMSANVANQYGWYCVAGAAPCKAGTVAAGVPYVTATAGQIDDAVVAGQGIDGMMILAADAGGLADCQLDHPSVGSF